MRLFLAALLLSPILCLGQSDSKEKTAAPKIPEVHTSIVISASPLQPDVDRRNSEVFEKTLFSRDDQIFHQLNGGINAGQHEGGGKSIEVRRFGFNLDHGGVGGGLKVLVDDVQQNQTTQGHGQGYLGSLKSLTPELIDEAQIINGPFSAEYGDFSGLGVVHIRLRESFPDRLTVRMQGGSFNSQRGFLSYSPNWKNTDAFFAFEGSHSDGPFVKALGYRRDNVTGNITRRLGARRSFAVKWNGGTNNYNSSGQIPLNEVGRLDRFGFLDPGEGGKIRAGTLAGYFKQELKGDASFKADAFLTRSLFDLYSNFTYFLNDPVNGDAIQQHDSRLVEGVNVQYLRPNRLGGGFGLLTAGSNYHDNQINVGLYSRVNRTPVDTVTAANSRVTNGAGYIQQTSSFLTGRLTVGVGLRYDWFRFHVQDRVTPALSNIENSTRFQPKFSIAYAPPVRGLSDIGLTLHFNYGRGISSIDARSITQSPNSTKLATTDFSQAGLSLRYRRVGFSADAFLIDRSNELVYVADDGTLELVGPSRAYGGEVKTSVAITSKLSFSGGITQVANAFYKGTSPREYVDRAPHFVANTGLTLSRWRGWSGSLRLRAINHYRLNTDDGPSQTAAGNTVTDFSMVRRLRPNLDMNFSVDNLFGRSYYETQNWIESRAYPTAPAAFGIHATPGYPRTFTIGLTARFGGK